MPRRIQEAQPQVRKSFLVIGGIVVGLAVVVFVVTNVLGGGGGGTPADTAAQVAPQGSAAPTTDPAATSAPVTAPSSAPKADEPASGYQIKPGGRNPFTPHDGTALQGITETNPVAVKGVVQSNDPVTVSVLSVYGSGADIKIGDKVYEGAKPGNELDERFAFRHLMGSCVELVEYGETFTLCSGESATR